MYEGHVNQGMRCLREIINQWAEYNNYEVILDEFDVRLKLEVPDAELEKRKQQWKPIHKKYDRGYVSLYQQHVEQAHLGADMDYLKGGSGSEVSRDSH